MTTRNASPSSGYLQNAHNRTSPPKVNTDLDYDLCARLGLSLHTLDTLPPALVESLRGWEASTANLRVAVQALLIVFEDQEAWAANATRGGVALFAFARAAVAQA
jgi:hypothetical protein